MLPSLNVIACINQLGYGVIGTNLLKAIVASGTNVSLWPIAQVDCQNEDKPLISEAIKNANSFSKNAPCIRIWHQFDMAQFVGKGMHAGYSFFELDMLTPIEKHHLSNLDVSLVSSQWAKDVLINNGVRNAYVVCPGVDLSIFHPGIKPAEIHSSSKNPTVFMHAGKWEIRKGADFVLDAFNAAFNPADEVVLIMACFNPLLPPEHSKQWERYFLNSKMGRAGKIVVLDHRLPTQQALAQLMAASDCGFFPARAEGWNLEAAEMLAMGKHVILTNYSAHTEYASRAGCDTIEIDKMEEAYDGVFFHGGVGQWAALGECQLDQAVFQLRSVHRLKSSQGKLDRNEDGFKLFTSELTWDNAWQSVVKSLGGNSWSPHAASEQITRQEE